MAEGTPATPDRDLDGPTPPGGPQRQDAPGEGAHHGGDETPRSPSYAPSEDDDEGVTTHEPDPGLQEENAGTSLDQPSQ